MGGLADMGRETETNLAKIGQASAAGVGAQGVTTSTNVANLLGQQGQAIAGGQVGQAKAYGQMLNLPAQFLGMQMGAGGKAGMGFGTLFG